MKAIYIKQYIGLLVVYALLLPVFMSTAIAQNIPVSKPLTLTETIQIAVVENPEVKAARFHVDSMESRANQARSGFFPQIHFSETFNRKNDRCRRSGGTRHLASDA